MSYKSLKKNYLLQYRAEALETENVKLQAIIQQKEEEIAELKGLLAISESQGRSGNHSDSSIASEAFELSSENDSISTEESQLEGTQAPTETGKEEIKARNTELELQITTLEEERDKLQHTIHKQRNAFAELEKMYAVSQTDLFSAYGAVRRVKTLEEERDELQHIIN